MYIPKYGREGRASYLKTKNWKNKNEPFMTVFRGGGEKWDLLRYYVSKYGVDPLVELTKELGKASAKIAGSELAKEGVKRLVAPKVAAGEMMFGKGLMVLPKNSQKKINQLMKGLDM